MSAEYLTIEHLTRKELTRVFGQVRVNRSRIYNDSPCWEFTGYLQDGGHALVRYRKLGKQLLHRIIFAWLVEPIPKPYIEHSADHLCRNPCCCNPCHIEIVSLAVNVLRSNCPPAINKRKTHCVHGHPLTPDNVYQEGNGRKCRICRKNRSQAFAERKRHDVEYLDAKRAYGREHSRQKRIEAKTKLTEE